MITPAFLFIIALMAIDLSSAAEFSFSYPPNIKVNESFTISIDAQGIYDVKIFVYEGDYSSFISELYDSGWRSPFKYIKEAYPSKKDFDIRIVRYSSDAGLCVQLREPGESSYIRECKGIIIDKEYTVNQTTQSSQNDSAIYGSSYEYSDEGIVHFIILYGFILLCIIIILFMIFRLL